MKIGELTINCANTSAIERLTISPLTYILMDYMLLVHIKTFIYYCHHLEMNGQGHERNKTLHVLI